MSDHGKSTDDIELRALGAVGLVGIAAIHLIDLPDKFEEVPYLGVMYVGLIIASALTAFALIAPSRYRREAWTTAALLAGATFIGYCLSRTTGLPASTDDIGNWGEPLGVLSLIVEAAVVSISLLAMRVNAAKSKL